MKVAKKKEKALPAPFVTREEWGAKPSDPKSTRLHLPLTSVRYGYTGTSTCRKKEQCIEVLQEYQDDYMDKGLEDQPYNFLVGGDGAIYEGRGWEFEAARPNRLKRFKGKCIDIAYIGEFESSLPPPKMTEVVTKFISEAILDKKLQDMPHVLNLHDFRAQDNEFD